MSLCVSASALVSRVVHECKIRLACDGVSQTGRIELVVGVAMEKTRRRCRTLSEYEQMQNRGIVTTTNRVYIAHDKKSRGITY